jgi:hypothetical protein
VTLRRRPPERLGFRTARNLRSEGRPASRIGRYRIDRMMSPVPKV